VKDEIIQTLLELVVFIYVVSTNSTKNYPISNSTITYRRRSSLQRSNNFYVISPTLNTFISIYIARFLEHFIPFITTLILMF